MTPPLLVAMRRNQKILIVTFLVVFSICYFLIPRRKKAPDLNKLIVNPKPRQTLLYYSNAVTKNDTLFEKVINQEFLHPKSKEALKKYLRPNQFSNSLDVKPKVQPVTDNKFDIEHDVIVYLHIQKVGGTVFNKHLIEDLILETPCRCEKDVLMNPCYCKNKHGHIWLFSWFTVGWPCGLHADWTMLHECVDTALDEIEKKQRKRRYYYITLLRDPVSRYLSEWQHQKRGENWEDAKLRCGGERVSLFDVRPCFQDTWEGVVLDEFMSCRENLATNRQTRMIADLKKSGCYKRNKMKEDLRAKIQLQSAIENLDQISFFGLTQYQKETQKLFEKMFNLKFKKQFSDLDDDVNKVRISEDEFIHMMKYIELDVQLYLRAKDLFLQRVGASL